MDAEDAVNLINDPSHQAIRDTMIRMLATRCSGTRAGSDIGRSFGSPACAAAQDQR